MATFPKIADNEMNYYQFKARQMLLLKKEDREWQEFCKKIAPECVACLSESATLKDSVDIGIQTNPRTSLKKFEKPAFKTRKKDEQFPEALITIMKKLENIDLALSKMYNVPEEREQKKKQEEVSYLKNANDIKSLEERRRLFIQNSLKTSLEKLPMFTSKVTKKPPTIQTKNSGYFLPHELQVKRAAARKAYLASLQRKPKVLFKKDNKITKETTQHIQNKRAVTKPALKSGKKPTVRKVLSNIDKEETLISAENLEAKDENIEFIADAILEDFLGEAALDLNKIKQRKRERELNKVIQKAHINRGKETRAVSELLNPSPAKNTHLKTLSSSDNRSLEKLKSFLDVSKKVDQSTTSEIGVCTEESTRKNIFSNEKPSHLPAESSSGKRDADPFQPNPFAKTKISPKFICDV